MKIRVFKTPSKKDNTEVHIGIPQGVQLDDSISSLQIAQIENLPPPKLGSAFDNPDGYSKQAGQRIQECAKIYVTARLLFTGCA